MNWFSEGLGILEEFFIVSAIFVLLLWIKLLIIVHSVNVGVETNEKTSRSESVEMLQSENVFAI